MASEYTRNLIDVLLRFTEIYFRDRPEATTDNRFFFIESIADELDWDGLIMESCNNNEEKLNLANTTN